MLLFKSWRNNWLTPPVLTGWLEKSPNLSERNRIVENEARYISYKLQDVQFVCYVSPPLLVSCFPFSVILPADIWKK